MIQRQTICKKYELWRVSSGAVWELVWYVYLSRNLGGWATPWSTEEVLEGHQRVDLPANARTALKGLLRERKKVEEGVFLLNRPLCPQDDPIGRRTDLKLNWTVVCTLTSQKGPVEFCTFWRLKIQDSGRPAGRESIGKSTGGKNKGFGGVSCEIMSNSADKVTFERKLFRKYAISQKDLTWLHYTIVLTASFFSTGLEMWNLWKPK